LAGFPQLGQEDFDEIRALRQGDSPLPVNFTFLGATPAGFFRDHTIPQSLQKITGIGSPAPFAADQPVADPVVDARFTLAFCSSHWVILVLPSED